MGKRKTPDPTLPAPADEPPDDVHCPRCGSFDIRHAVRKPTKRFLRHNRGAKVQPVNVCGDCGQVSEYIPSRAVIAAECRDLREARDQGDEEADVPRGPDGSPLADLLARLGSSEDGSDDDEEFDERAD